MNTIIKLILTSVILISVIITYGNSSTNSEFVMLFNKVGTVGLIAIVTVFFTAIVFYCKALQSCLSLVAPENRTANPKSVWFMFLLPFNFIEDFFIVINVSNSIEAEAKKNKKLNQINDYGMFSGIGWSIAQIMSFIPNIAGQIAGVIGIILWIFHWRLIIKINKSLKTI